MRILKRNGNYEGVSFDKILRRITNITNDPNLVQVEDVDCDILAQKVIQQIYDGISSKKLDGLTSEIAIAMSVENIGYGTIASRIAINNLHKSTPDKFSDAVEILYTNGLINDTFYDNLQKNKETIDLMIDNNRDYLIEYFGYKTLEKSYLVRVDGKIIERPQYMWMRVALALHGDNLTLVKDTYDNLSLKRFIHASPTLFNAGSKREQCSSCFILQTFDSLEGIFKTMTDCAKISKFAGGIGLSISNIRAKGTLIKGTNGKSDGLVPMMKVYNEISRYINQGGKRNGSFALYLEPHHADIEEFLEMKKNTGDPNLRARDLFYALWVSDLFMKTVEEDGVWHMFCPETCPGMCEAYGKDYEELYNKYVQEGRFTKTIKARTLWEKILVSQIETGTPYISYKDAVNIKNNQKHLGTITSSNLCNEISLYNTPESTAVCNIATISLVSCVVDGKFDFNLLGSLARSLVTNLNKVIDINFYPTPEAEHNNTNYRPVAIGVSGYYDTFMVLKYPFDSEEASVLNKQIFECIQYNAYYRSCELAIEQGPYSAFKGSPMSEGIFQHNMWGLDESKLQYDWAGLRKMIMENGVRNSMLTALPPTASTASILGNVESFEVITSNFYMRNVLSGTFPIINKHLAKDLKKLGLWNKDIVNDIISNDGSIQNIKNIPTELKKLYKTTWETSQKVTVNLSADRGPFIDHTQSLNIFMEKPSIAKLTSMHFYGWKKGLKTGSYYIRSRPITKAEQFTVKQASEELVCSLDNPESCAMCEG